MLLIDALFDHQARVIASVPVKVVDSCMPILVVCHQCGYVESVLLTAEFKLVKSLSESHCSIGILGGRFVHLRCQKNISLGDSINE